MSDAHVRRELHRLIDRLRPDQLRRLRQRLERDPDFAVNADEPAEAAGPDGTEVVGRLAIIGCIDSGHENLSEQAGSHA